MDNPVSLSGWRFYAALSALAFALLIPAGLAAKAQLDLRNADAYRVPIAGYDPRDMLRGHYLVFRFEWPWVKGREPDENICAEDMSNCCVCLSGDKAAPTAHLQMCPKTPDDSCPAPLRGYAHGNGQFDIGISQYYIPESRAEELEDLLREGKTDFRLGLVSRPGAKALIEKLYIGGKSLEHYSPAETKPD